MKVTKIKLKFYSEQTDVPPYLHQLIRFQNCNCVRSEKRQFNRKKRKKSFMTKMIDVLGMMAKKSSIYIW